jgi:lysophospholipase
MYGVNLPWYLKPVATLIGQLITALYPKPTFAPGQAAYFPKPFEGNFLSQSQVRYQWFRELYEQNPELKIGGASTRWVWQGLLSCQRCHLMTRHIQAPLLVMQAGDDKIVSNIAQSKFMTKLAKTHQHCEFKVIEGARHELLFEQDRYRNQVLDHTMTFFNQY